MLVSISILFLTFITLDCVPLTEKDKDKINDLNADLLVFDYFPKHFVNITWDTGISVQIGDRVPINKIRNKPNLTWPVCEGFYYTIFFTDYSDSQYFYPEISEYHLWFVTNVPGLDVEKGEEQCSYKLPPLIPGWTRIAVSVLEQPNKFDYTGDLAYIKRPLRNTVSVRKVNYESMSLLKAGNVYIVTT